MVDLGSLIVERGLEKGAKSFFTLNRGTRQKSGPKPSGDNISSVPLKRGTVPGQFDRGMQISDRGLRILDGSLNLDL